MSDIIPIGGGKGGVGKSLVAVHKGALIAKRGQRVVLLDLDLGASNLHTFLGIKNPPAGIDDFLDKKVSSLAKVAVPTPYSNLAFISSLHCSIEIPNLYHAQKVKLINAIKTLPYDYIILDLGAGTNFNTLDFFLTSDKGVFVCTPEPTAIENAFRFIKAVYLRKLKQIITLNTFHKMVKQAVVEPGRRELASNDIIDLVLKYDPGREMFLRETISRFYFRFILNQVRSSIDPDLGEKIKTVCNRHFYSKFQFLGNVCFDDRVSDSILKRKLFALYHPDAEASESLRAIAEQLSRKRSAIDRMSEVP